MPHDLLMYLGAEFHSLHRLMTHVTADISDEQANHVPSGGNQNIAFSLWHYVRTEDNVVNFVVQGKPTVWINGGWPEKFGLDAKSQGTGFTDDEARGFRLNSFADFRAYMADVFKTTEEFVASLDDEAAMRMVTVKPLGEMTVLQALSGVGMTHGYRHLGEVEFAKGLVAPRGGATI
jgi:hypothetical protein